MIFYNEHMTEVILIKKQVSYFREINLKYILLIGIIIWKELYKNWIKDIMRMSKDKILGLEQNGIQVVNRIPLIIQSNQF